MTPENAIEIYKGVTKNTEFNAKWIKALVFYAIDINDNVVSWCQKSK